MGRNKFLNAVDISGLRGVWRKLVIDDEDLVEARQSRACGFQEHDFGSYPRYTRMHTKTPDRDIATGPANWARRQAVHGSANMLFELGASYAFDKAWSIAVAQSDPALAPHVQFRMLKHRDHAEALLFLKSWGPLTLNNLDQSDSAAVDLNDFWHKHNWFVAVAQLYEALEEPRELKRAWQRLVDQAVASARADQAHSQSNSTIRIEFDTDRYRRDVILFAAPHHGVSGKLASDFILGELKWNTQAASSTSWEVVSQTSQLSFRPIRFCSSLWAAMWEMFGLDTERGFAWRSCRICTKYFYPSQANSVCCTPEHQSLWSKRQWARRSRSLGPDESKSGKRLPGQEAVSPSIEKSVVAEVK